MAIYQGGKQKILFMHRLVNNTMKSFDTDHINFDTLDNRKTNLRSANKQQNGMNRGLNKNNKTGYKGVCVVKNQIIAQIMVNGRHIFLENYLTYKDAANAYNQAAIKYFGEFAWLNKID